MCHFMSWIEKDGSILYLTDAEINSKRGKELRDYLGTAFKEDVVGHGAIRWFYELSTNTGTNKECTDFSSPKNFPPEIVKDIKAGKFRLIGFSEGLLSRQAWDKYEKIEGPAWAEYEKIKEQAWDKYEKIKEPAWAEYKKIEKQALAEYEKIKEPALAEYEKIKEQAFWDLFKVKKNRTKGW